jgi:hypothetical protein
MTIGIDRFCIPEYFEFSERNAVLGNDMQMHELSGSLEMKRKCCRITILILARIAFDIWALMCAAHLLDPQSSSPASLSKITRVRAHYECSRYAQKK